MIIDAHTHKPANDAIASLDVSTCTTPLQSPFTAGFHPWYMSGNPDFNLLETVAENRFCVGIGECGIDTQRSTVGKETQIEILARHIELSEKMKLPLVLHIVGGWDTVLNLKKQMRPEMPWIIHGFRGKPELAKQLTVNGIALSYGEKYNTGSVISTPLEQMLAESDGTTADINVITANLAVLKNCDPEYFRNTIRENIRRLFPKTTKIL